MIAYDINGNVIQNERAACAAEDIGAKKYFIKCSNNQTNHGVLYNPKGLFAQGNDLTKFDSLSGRFAFEFREVKPIVFDNYFQFLLTKRETFLSTAERMYLYG